ncbi:MAG: valine--tRNA ligase [Rickettsiales bacterium]
MKQLEQNYDHKKKEKYWQDYWVEKGTYHWRDDKPREETFVIDTPPPTVSGVLHMGHIFSYTQADFIARYQRMAGKDVFYPMGFDDNGLPTERLVEKIKKVRGSSMPRADFVAMCKDVVRDAEEDFRKLFKSTALSVDWRQEYQTINDDVRKLSQESFIDLLKKGEIYRDFRPTYWDWVDGTAIASAEIENKEMSGVMNEIVFGLEGEVSRPSEPSAMPHVSDSMSRSGGESIIIMTTRPELLGACVAVMYHPEDENAAKYEGKFAITPLFGVKVPMIADEAVERDKGTGLVMCCTFGDDTDKEWWRKYKLPLRALLTKEGKLDFNNQLFVDSFAASGQTAIQIPQQVRDDTQGLKPKQANAKIIELLQTEGKLLKQTPMTHTVKCAERSGTPIEIIPTYQWFIRLTDKKEELLKKGAEVNWYPEYMKIRLNQWIEGLKEDWCISRQRFFGVPIPVWYSKRSGEEGKILFPDAKQLPIDPLVDLPEGYGKDEVKGDADILDTWATSSISPQINARAIGGGDRYQKLFPADMRPQAHEIIRTWAFYTIAKAHLHADAIPWKNIVISGWCLASDKTKMSKSKGNVVTPVALIEEKGTDSVRYWASTSRLGTDTAFSEDLLKIGRKLVNKLWNACKFASMNLSKLDGTPSTAAADAKNGVINESLDLWILSRLNKAVAKSTELFEKFEYCDARVAIEDFFWNDFCDNYLELVKTRAYGEGDINSSAQQSALYTLYHCLDAILRLFAPFVPHITEELYSHIFDNKFEKSGSVHSRGNWPLATDYPHNENHEKSGISAVDVLNVIRKAKSEAGVSIKAPVAEVKIIATGDGDLDLLTMVAGDLKAAGNVHEIIEADNDNLTYTSDLGWFKLSVRLAVIEEHKRNSEQAEYEKIDKDGVLYGKATPDLSKHTVKVQVNRVPDNLERQK